MSAPAADPTPLIRRVQEALFDTLIDVHPVESVRDGWHEAECDTCAWRTTGLETIVEDAAYEHISNIHMAAWSEIVEPIVLAFVEEKVR